MLAQVPWWREWYLKLLHQARRGLRMQMTSRQPLCWDKSEVGKVWKEKMGVDQC